MAYEAKILADSEAGGVRLTTMEVTFPRIVLAEFNTHRILSRSSASSRAIPVSKMLERVQQDPFIPIWWGKNQKGMQAAEKLDLTARTKAVQRWLEARDNAILSVQDLQAIDVHKQIANRLLEPWLWHTVIVTATEWENFFALRTHKDAQPEIRRIAEMIKALYTTAEPTRPPTGWHLPLVPDLQRLRDASCTDQAIARISAARCARVSYLTHDGVRDPQADLDLADRLQNAGHMSPFEHVAYAASSQMDNRFAQSNFRHPWVQYRKTLPNEAVFRGTETP